MNFTGHEIYVYEKKYMADITDNKIYKIDYTFSKGLKNAIEIGKIIDGRLEIYNQQKLPEHILHRINNLLKKLT